MNAPCSSDVSDDAPVAGVDAPERLTVLLVEDNQGDARLVEILLRQSAAFEYEVVHVNRFEDALIALAERSFSAVLLDLGLPDIDGAETVHSLQRHRQELPIIVLSGRDSEELALTLVSAGAQDYLIKGSVDGDGLARSIAYGVRRKKAELALRHLAQHDPLTGLANRLLFDDRIEHAIGNARRQNTRVALMFLDLDRFKNINDTLGHDVGDALLKSVARRLRSVVREVDTVARMGGDEFTVLFENAGRVSDVCNLAEKILASMEAPFEVLDHKIVTSTSIGLAFFPDSAGDPSALVRNADAAMYCAKKEGRAGYRIYAPEMHGAMLDEFEEERRLREAIDRNRFELHFQPQLGLGDRRLCGMEALVRWRDGDCLVNPGDFIPLAERSGLIIPLGEWILHAACRQGRQWRDAGLGDCRVAVNLSARQLEDDTIVGLVDAVLRDTAVPPDCLELELTETMLMQDPQHMAELLGELRGRRVRVSVDDFGTGYCSLSNLRTLPLDTLKVDRSFVAHLDQNVEHSIAVAITNLAHSLGLSVVAEGVETQRQLEQLRALGSDAVQGFLIARPALPGSISMDPAYFASSTDAGTERAGY